MMASRSDARADRTGFAPLVAPGPELLQDQKARAARQMLLPGFDETAQRRLAAARVLVIGAGGLGCASAPYLAGAGVGTIGIVDDDRVDLSNLHRQVAHDTADISKSKSESLVETLRGINPNVRAIAHTIRLTAQNALEIFGEYDLVLDGSDNYPTRYLANDAASLVRIPLVWGAILEHHGQISVAWHAHGPGYRDLFPNPPNPDEVVTCTTGGVLPGLCGTIGSLMATEAMKIIAGLGDPLVGRVLVYDAFRARTREIRYEPDPMATPITELIDYELFCTGRSTPSAITVDQLRQRMTRDDVQLVDVRTRAERAQSHIASSYFLPLADLESGVALTGLAGGNSVTVYCAKGPRSIRAAQILRERGIEANYLIGGIEQCIEIAPKLIAWGK